MKLNGINILDVAVLKQNFSLEGLYPCVDNGTLLTFEQSAPVQGSFLAGEILTVLRSLQDGLPPDFLARECLEPERMRRRLEAVDSSFHAYTFDIKTQQDFFDRSWEQIMGLASPLCAGCTAEQAWRFYLCILLHLQSRPKLPLRQVDAAFIARTFPAAARPAPPPGGKAADQTVCSDRLCLCGSQLLFLSGGRLYALDRRQNSWQVLHDGPIRSYACTPALGLITADPSGAVAAPARPELCHQAEGHSICAVTAYADRYVLLTGEGRLLSNLKLPDGLCWQQAQQLRLGLNSLSCIVGELRGGLQYGSAPALHSFTGIRSLYTRSDGVRRYAVLRENGDLYVDGRDQPIPHVRAACLSPQGYFYATDKLFSLLRFDGTTQALLCLPKGSAVQEICADENNAVLLCRVGERDVLLTTWQNGPLPALPDCAAASPLQEGGACP